MFDDKCKTILKQKCRFYHKIDNTNALIEAKHIICLKRRQQMQKKKQTLLK
jgi:predicted GNAT family N-acyltransferase